MERSSVADGRLYPADPEALAEELSRLFGEGAENAEEVPALAAIAPHGAMEVSGPIATAVYQKVRIPSVVVLLSASHTGHPSRGSIMTHGTFRLPGGGVPIDTRVAEELRAVGLMTEDTDAHRHEHAIEVHLPYLRHRNPRVRIVPVTFGPLPLASCIRVGTALADVMNGHARNVMAVASSTFTHYLPDEEVRSRDEALVKRVEQLDVEGWMEAASSDRGPCGLVPIAVVMAAARALGASSAQLVARGTSAAATGDAEQSAGYAGFFIR